MYLTNNKQLTRSLTQIIKQMSLKMHTALATVHALFNFWQPFNFGMLLFRLRAFFFWIRSEFEMWWLESSRTVLSNACGYALWLGASEPASIDTSSNWPRRFNWIFYWTSNSSWTYIICFWTNKELSSTQSVIFYRNLL